VEVQRGGGARFAGATRVPRFVHSRSRVALLARHGAGGRGGRAPQLCLAHPLDLGRPAGGPVRPRRNYILTIQLDHGCGFHRRKCSLHVDSGGQGKRRTRGRQRDGRCSLFGRQFRSLRSVDLRLALPGKGAKQGTERKFASCSGNFRRQAGDFQLDSTEGWA